MQITRNYLRPQSEYSFSHSSSESIIFHTTLGNNYQGARDTLAIRHLSYHFIIDEWGRIFQLIDIGRGAWGAGATSNMNVRATAFFGRVNPNKKSVQIAFVRNGHKTITKSQRDSAVWLVKHIGQQTGIRYNRTNIFYHREVTNYNAWAKPPEVAGYMEQVLDGLVGFKDNKDNVSEDYLRMYIKYLRLKIQLLLLQQKAGVL
jgi:N-acetyl-anhydromuramyl-L-alanine amidase AmpD